MSVGALLSGFLGSALLAGSCIAFAAGCAGWFLVLRHEVFVGDALSHVAFTGALGALVLGVAPLGGLFVATIAFAVVLGMLSERGPGRDIVIGTVFAWVLGLGVLFLTLYTAVGAHGAGNGKAGITYLFGTIYALSSSATLSAVAVSLAVVVGLAAIARPLLFASVDPAIAAARGIPVRALGIAFLVLVGVTVGEAVQVVGALLILGLLVTPAAIVRRVVARPYVGIVASGLIAVGAVWVGLTLSSVWPALPPSFTIVGTVFAVYAATALRRPGASRTPRRYRPSPRTG